ncbi:hypothetical protein [Patulibacter defluvii]|uniref:hypothetical protein n=1 Tax=Patulibacter defluvii TaxID=3095358 RepID=UPI002A759DD2|nr:hypothetical protein [Patulibacter sp. DM4]
MSGWDALQVAAPWLWVGMVLAISFLEAPLKFRAPGITVPLAVAIGRIVFRALNGCELVLALLATLALVAGDAQPTAAVVALVVAWWALLVKAGAVRPLMDRRARRVVAGEDPGPSPLHLWYVGLELATVLAVGAYALLSLDAIVG